MTVPSSAERNDYTGAGSTATYAYGFRITNEDHLLATVADTDGAETTLTKTTDYTVTGVGIKTGGNIVLVDNSQDWIDENGYLKTGYALTVRHYVPLAQSYDIRNLGAYYLETNEDAIDYLMWVCKQQQDEIDRCVKTGETGGEIPTPAEILSALAATEEAQIAAEAAQAAAELAETGAEAAETNAETAQAAAQVAQAAAEAAAANSVLLTGDQTVAGNKTFSSSPIVPTPTTDMQASTKKYVDDNKAALGSWVDKSSSYGAQQAATDGFVCAYLTSAGGETVQISGYTDSNSNPTTVRSASRAANDELAVVSIAAMPVKKGDYWKVVVSGGSPVVYWIPFGS